MFVMVNNCVFIAVGFEFLNITDAKFGFKRLNKAVSLNLTDI